MRMQTASTETRLLCGNRQHLTKERSPMAKKRKFKSYTKRRTNQEEYEFLIEVRDRLQFRLSHQNECFINCIRTEELDLARVIREIQVMDEIGFGMLGGSLDL